jgi:hypothetical protein
MFHKTSTEDASFYLLCYCQDLNVTSTACCCQLPIGGALLFIAESSISSTVGQPQHHTLSQCNTERTVVRYWRKAREIREALIRTLLLRSGISLYLLFPKQFSCFLVCDLSIVPIGYAFFVKLLRGLFVWGLKYLTDRLRS